MAIFAVPFLWDFRYWPMGEQLGMLARVYGVAAFLVLVMRAFHAWRDRMRARRVDALIEDDEAPAPPVRRRLSHWVSTILMVLTGVAAIPFLVPSLADYFRIREFGYPVFFFLLLAIVLLEFRQEGEQDLYEARFTIGGRQRSLRHKKRSRRKHWTFYGRGIDTAPRDDE